jgi:hypothetical protein
LLVLVCTLDMDKRLTDGTGVGLDGGIEVSQKADCVGALGDDRAGNREAAEGEEREVSETHYDG